MKANINDPVFTVSFLNSGKREACVSFSYDSGHYEVLTFDDTTMIEADTFEISYCFLSKIWSASGKDYHTGDSESFSFEDNQIAELVSFFWLNEIIKIIDENILSSRYPEQALQEKAARCGFKTRLKAKIFYAK